MKAGRELDALIAQKIFGISKNELRGLGATWNRRNDVTGYYLPHYSIDIVAAWEVVDHFKDGAVHRLYDHEKKEDHYVAVFKKGCEYSAQTAPLAICLAALKAVGVEE